MPYITKERANVLDEHPQKALYYGELNYLYTKRYIKMWESCPCYRTFHIMSSTILTLEISRDILELTYLLLSSGWSRASLLIARREAIEEFRRRALSKYEDKKRKDKKNVDPYRGIKI